MPGKMCFEDFDEGFVYEFEVPGLSVDAITRFASKYDPQRFHVDAEAAAQTHFGGLIASGFQTQLLCFRPFCDDVLLDSWAIGAPGIDSLRWLRPWYPGEDLTGTVTLVERRRSSRRPDRGYLVFHLRAGAGGKPTFAMDWTVIMLTREGAASVAATP